MLCFVYRSNRRDQTYVYLARKDDFEALPDDLRERVEPLELVLEVDLHPERKLAMEDPAAVIRNLGAQGWHLQLPRHERSLLQAVP
ncbi:MAG: YcgL domain-containing protein [Xanthomonadales bacterium]|nr:YcgL domain-containing protein [Xanthomonadales bacterium]